MKRYQQGVIGAMERIQSQGNFSMPHSDDSDTLPSEYWERDGHLRFHLKDGVSASAALDAIFAYGGEIDCELAVQIAFAEGVRRALGDDAFDAWARQGPPLNFSETAIDAESKLKEWVTYADASHEASSIPGDLVYHLNTPKYREASSGGWQGENTVVGRADGGPVKYLGFPLPPGGHTRGEVLHTLALHANVVLPLGEQVPEDVVNKLDPALYLLFDIGKPQRVARFYAAWAAQYLLDWKKR